MSGDYSKPSNFDVPANQWILSQCRFWCWGLWWGYHSAFLISSLGECYSWPWINFERLGPQWNFFFLEKGGVGVLEGGKTCFTSSKTWKCLLNFIPLHFLNSKGEINPACLLPPLPPFQRMVLVNSHREGLSVLQRVWCRALPLCFSANTPGWWAAIGREQNFWSS